MNSKHDDLDIAFTLLRNPDAVNRIIQHAIAHMQLGIHTERAQEHCKKNDIGRWGDNIWVAILEDSIKHYEKK